MNFLKRWKRQWVIPIFLKKKGSCERTLTDDRNIVIKKAGKGSFFVIRDYITET